VTILRTILQDSSYLPNDRREAPLVIDLENITVRFGGQTILDGISFQFEGGCMGLLGPNGAGKTTLLKTLVGFIRPDCGGARILGHDLHSRTLQIRQRIGYMPENDCHIPGMNAVSFVAFAGQLAGLQPKDSLQRAHEVLNYVDLGDARYHDLGTCSMGMKQRIKLAQALVHDPELVFLDEPTSGLDPRGRLDMLELIRDVSCAKGIHVVLSSHLLPDVERVCGEAIVIDRGKLLASGNMDELKGAGTRVFECRVKGDAEAFIRALDDLSCRCRQGEEETIRIEMPEGFDGRSLWRVARDQRVQIRHLKSVERSLEDAFLQVIGESNAHP
jgi:ABC-2 type transport system ATP-binding protein